MFDGNPTEPARVAIDRANSAIANLTRLGRTGHGGRPSRPTLRKDTRAIEGLPVRLVIALVVGVASLSVMMNMLSGVQGLAVTELDVRPQPEVVTPGAQDITFTVVGSDGDLVEDATIIVKGGSAVLDGGVATARSDRDGNATVSVAPELRANQDEGTLTVKIKPPAGSQFADRRENTVVLVIRE